MLALDDGLLELVGINNRDLETFQVNLGNTADIMDEATKKAKIDANDAIYSPDTSLNSSLNSSNESSFNSTLNSSNDSSLNNSSTAASSFNESSF